jgi:hypothetical protein
MIFNSYRPLFDNGFEKYFKKTRFENQYHKTKNQTLSSKTSKQFRETKHFSMDINARYYNSI